MTKFHEWPDLNVDLLVGGTPCQAFSVAGLRKGLADPRGNLTLTFLGMVDRYRPRWIVWENVPGVLSDRTNAFGQFLAGLAKLGYGVVYRVLDAQYFGLAQRRKRVFVVGYFGDWTSAAKVFFEPQSVRGDHPPRRETRQKVAGTLSARTQGGGGLGTDFDLGGGLVSHSLRAEGFDASEDGTGRGTPLVSVNTGRGFWKESDKASSLGAGPRANYESTLVSAIQERAICENPDAGPDGIGVRSDGLAYTLEARQVPQAVAFSCKDSGTDAGEISPTLRSMGHSGSHPNAGGQVAIAFHHNAQACQLPGKTRDTSISDPLTRSQNAAVALEMSVRRLTPRECERLQGFPDDYTQIPFRKKPSTNCPDGPRYKALGNSMAVPCMRWIGKRIAIADAVSLNDDWT